MAQELITVFTTTIVMKLLRYLLINGTTSVLCGELRILNYVFCSMEKHIRSHRIISTAAYQANLMHARSA